MYNLNETDKSICMSPEGYAPSFIIDNELMRDLSSALRLLTDYFPDRIAPLRARLAAAPQAEPPHD